MIAPPHSNNLTGRSRGRHWTDSTEIGFVCKAADEAPRAYGSDQACDHLLRVHLHSPNVEVIRGYAVESFDWFRM
jgi:hypothetical protein